MAITENLRFTCDICGYAENKPNHAQAEADGWLVIVLSVVHSKHVCRRCAEAIAEHVVPKKGCACTTAE